VEDALSAVADTGHSSPSGHPPTASCAWPTLGIACPPVRGLVGQVIDRALSRRPDLSARLAALRASEAETQRARAEFWPRLSFSGSAGQAVQRYRAGPPFGTFTMNETEYGAFLNFEWKLFDGFERENALREAISQRGAASELAALELRRSRWEPAMKTALRKQVRDRSLAA
jgi:outer membrane protein TolC